MGPFDLLCTDGLTSADCIHLYVLERRAKLLSHKVFILLLKYTVSFAPDGCEGGDSPLTDPLGSTVIYSHCFPAKS